MVAELARQAWFIRVRTTERPLALLDFAVAKATLQGAIAAILHRAELDLGDEVTSTSELSAVEIASHRLRPDEVGRTGAGSTMLRPAVG